MTVVDPLSLVFLLAVFLLVVALNRDLFRRLGAGGTLRMVLIWASVLAGLAMVVTLAGGPGRFGR